MMYGTIDNPEDLNPKGEFFCRYRESWMPEIKGMPFIMMEANWDTDVNVFWIGIFQKQEIKE